HEQLGDSSRNVSGVADAVPHRRMWDPRRNKNCGYPYSQPIELELHPRTSVVGQGRKFIRSARRRHDVVVNTSMLVINDQQRCTSPHFRVSLDPHVHLADQKLPRLDVMLWMLITGPFLVATGF